MNIGRKVDRKLIRELQIASKSGGDENRHLENIISGETDEDDEENIRKRVEGFNKLSIRMSSSILYLFDHPDQIRAVEFDKLKEVREKLDDLWEVMDSQESEVEEVVTDREPHEANPDESEEVVTDQSPPEAPPQ